MRGYATSTPLASTATVLALASRHPRCAIASIPKRQSADHRHPGRPRARGRVSTRRPARTRTAAATRSRQQRAVSASTTDDSRVAYRTGGGWRSSRSGAGYDRPCGQARSMPPPPAPGHARGAGRMSEHRSCRALPQASIPPRRESPNQHPAPPREPDRQPGCSRCTSAARNPMRSLRRRQASHASVMPRPASGSVTRYAERLVEVIWLDLLGRRKVGDRPREAQARGPGPCQRDDLARPAWLPSVPRGPRCRADVRSEACERQPPVHGQKPSSRRAVVSLTSSGGRRLAELAHEIDPVEERSAEPPGVADPVDVVARAVALAAARMDSRCTPRPASFWPDR